MNRIIEKYIPIARLVAETFGDNCEVVLHDFSEPQKSVAFTLNNHVTGRTVGQSFDHLIKKVLLSQDFQNDCSSNYYACEVPGKIIKSSTAIIRDESNNVIGTFCVNIDVTNATQFEQLLAQFISKQEITTTVQAEKGRDATDEVEVIENVMDIVNKIIDNVLLDKDLSCLSRENKIELLSFMYDKGVFLIKGTVEKVAEKMEISRVTVYSYLDEIKKRNAP